MKEFERLTERDKFGNADIIGVDTNSLIGNLTVEQGVKTSEALDRLADFEDKIENGLMIELPCKKGTIIYFIEKDCWGCPLCFSDYTDWTCDIDGHNFDNEIYGEQCRKQLRIRELKFSTGSRNNVWGTKFYKGNGLDDNYDCTYFLTKAEAEEKLKEILEKSVN